MTIRLNLKRTTGKTTTIRAIIRSNGEKRTVSTGVKVEIKDWDRKRERCKTDYEANRRLDEAIEKIRKNVNPKERKQSDEKDLIQVIQEHKRKKVAESTSKHTWRTYTTLSTTIKNFKNCKLNEVNAEYIEGLQTWLKSKNYRNGHIVKMIQTLKAVIKNKVPAEELNQTKPPPNKHSDKIYLTTEEIEKIENLDTTHDNRLQKTKVKFLAGYYTGLRFSDWEQIGKARTQKIKGKEVLTITNQKTNTSTTIPLTKKLKEIIEQYPNGIETISNQKTNEYIKEICKKAGITQTVEITEHRAGTSIKIKKQKWELVTSHTARRSFATNAIIAGIPMVEVMKFTGHKSVQQFLTYVRTTSQETALKYANHEFFGE